MNLPKSVPRNLALLVLAEHNAVLAVPNLYTIDGQLQGLFKDLVGQRVKLRLYYLAHGNPPSETFLATVTGWEVEKPADETGIFATIDSVMVRGQMHGIDRGDSIRFLARHVFDKLPAFQPSLIPYQPEY